MRRCFFYLVCGLLPFFEQQIVSHPIATVETLLRVPPQEFQNYQHLVAEYPATRVALDQWLLRHECHEEAMLEYADPDQDLSHVTLPLDLCRCWYHLKRYLDVVEHCQDFPHLMALTYHYLQQYHEASSWYRLAESLHPDVAQLHYDYAVTLDRQGLIHQACARYNTALALDASLAYVWLNLAALHQRFGDIKTAIKLYHEALRRVTGTSQRPTTQARMISTNLAIAYEQVGQFDLAFHWYGQSLGRNENHHDSQLGAEEILSLRAHEYRAAQKIGSWEHHEAWQVELIVATRRQCQEGARGRATVLPYDAMKFGPAFRPLDAKRLAERYAQELESSTFFRNHDDYVFKNDPTHKLVIGYLSHDFYDHITLELMEGLFVYHNIDALDVHAFNYGKENHNSSLCQRIERDTGVVFHNVVSLGNEEIAVAIQETGVQILLDAQAFTMGSRDEIMATKPSPITVSYLVYPGTMGAPYIDYVIVDRHVAQVETSMDQFTEKLVVLPDCYQVNYYEHLLNPHRKDDERMDHEEGRSAFGIPSSERRDWDLPPNVFVFANLNKNDKIDPSVFALWMRILRQVCSVLFHLILLVCAHKILSNPRFPRVSCGSCNLRFPINLNHCDTI